MCRLSEERSSAAVGSGLPPTKEEPEEGSQDPPARPFSEPSEPPQLPHALSGKTIFAQLTVKWFVCEVQQSNIGPIHSYTAMYLQQRSCYTEAQPALYILYSNITKLKV